MSSPASPPDPVDPVQLRRATLTCAVGSALEYYDFAIYGTASALVLGKVFFPALGTAGGLAASFATYGVGFLARPLGAWSRAAAARS
jgi:MFS transporter, MHS family, metabolite:H+ symporter